MFGTTFEDLARLSKNKIMVRIWLSTDGNVDGKFEVLLLGASIGSLDRLEVGCTEGTEL